MILPLWWHRNVPERLKVCIAFDSHALYTGSAPSPRMGKAGIGQGLDQESLRFARLPITAYNLHDFISERGWST